MQALVRLGLPFDLRTHRKIGLTALACFRTGEDRGPRSFEMCEECHLGRIWCDRHVRASKQGCIGDIATGISDIVLDDLAPAPGRSRGIGWKASGFKGCGDCRVRHLLQGCLGRTLASVIDREACCRDGKCSYCCHHKHVASGIRSKSGNTSVEVQKHRTGLEWRFAGSLICI